MSPLRAILMRRPSRGLFKAYLNAEFNGYRKFITQILPPQVRVVDAEKTYPKIPTEDIKKSYPDKTIIINDIDDIFLSAAPPQKLSQEENQSVLKKLCDTVAEVAGNVVEDASWVERLPFLFQCVNSNVNRLKVSALLIFGQLAQHMGPQLQPHLSTLHALFQQTLSPSMPNDVRSTSLWAVAYFVKTLDSAKDRNIFQDLLPAMMQTVTQALEMHEEATTQDALEMLIEIARSEPQFIRKQLVSVVGSILRIVEAEGLEESTQCLAVEFRISLTEARERAPGMMRKLPHMKQLADYIVPALVDSLRKEPDMEVLIDMLISLNECLKIAASLIDPAQIKGMVDELQQAHTASSTRKKERAEHSHDEELDAEESEIIQKENDVQNLMSQFTKCVFLCFPMLQITWPMKILRRQVILFQLI